jgi:hypothetical protein
MCWMEWLTFKTFAESCFANALPALLKQHAARGHISSPRMRSRALTSDVERTGAPCAFACASVAGDSNGGGGADGAKACAATTALSPSPMPSGAMFSLSLPSGDCAGGREGTTAADAAMLTDPTTAGFSCLT